MKKILTIIFILTAYFSNGQVATLDLNNPAPRVGDEIEILVYFKMKDLHEKEGKKTADEWKSEQENNLGSGNLKFYENILDTGLIKIGPFKFSINNKEFVTDIITVRVYPNLPDVKDGIWIRQVNFKDETFLILEQRLSNQWNNESKSDDEHSMTHSSDGVTYTGIDIKKLKELGLALKEVGSSTSSQVVDIKDIFGSGTVSYKLTKYKVTRLDNFKGKVKIKREFFIDYPDKVELPIIVVE